jgi:hypothetical protein
MNVTNTEPEFSLSISNVHDAVQPQLTFMMLFNLSISNVHDAVQPQY